MQYDVAVIGAGVIGSLITRELSRYRTKVCLLDKEADVAMGTTKANSAIVHAGYDPKPGSLKGVLCVEGNRLMGDVCKELGVPFRRNGSLVAAFTEGDMDEVHRLYDLGNKNKVPGLEVWTKEQVLKNEPNISDKVLGALYAPSAGIVGPYELNIAAVENAAANGAELIIECEVKGIEKTPEGFVLSTGKGEIQARFVVNAAGLYSDDISKLAGDDGFSINPRKGEYLLLDKGQGSKVKKVIFQPPSKLGKGILVTPTVDGNLLIGPTAKDVSSKKDLETTSEGLDQVVKEALNMVPSINLREVITSFAGLRAVPSTGDFVIKASKILKGFVNAAGIESPGLTASPAIARYVVEILRAEGLELVEDEGFNPLRKQPYRFREANEEERAEWIKKDSRFGRIICRCEKVTEGEVVDCITRPAGAKNLDAVKRRTRAGMGRCQGGFCTPRLVEILARELGISPLEVTKAGKGSMLLLGKTKSLKG